MRKLLLLLCILSVYCTLATAQDFEFGKITPEEIEMKSYAKDPSAHAVVLQEFGRSRIQVSRNDFPELFYEYHVKIKIFDNKGFDKGTVEIPVYNNKDNDSYEEVDEISGVTFYTDDNGVIKKTELEDKKIYPVKENKHWANYKFALPGIRKDCIIEYKYRVTSPYYENFHSWNMQSDIPKIYSEYEVHIPGFWNYNASLKGNLKLTKNKSELESSCFTARGSSCDCSLMNYGIRDIPAFKDEDFMTARKNYLSAINFELIDYTSPYDGIKRRYTKDWKDIDYQLKDDPYFGSPLKRKGFFKEKIVPVIAGKTTDLDKAKAIFEFVQKWYKWNDFTGFASLDGIGKAYETRSGSVADINLSLVNALNAGGITSQAVLLSTRTNGTVNPLYPVLTEFNYVIAKADIDGKSYLLDGTDPLLPFGMLPFRCLNDKGRVFSLDKPSYWIDLGNLQKERKTNALEFTLQENGKLKGTIIRYSMGYDAYEKRQEIKKFNSVNEYIEKLNEESPRERITKSEILDLDSLNKPLTERYEVEIDAFDKLTNKIAFNPFFQERIANNPFRLAERSFPVDMGMPSDERFTLIVHLPDSYVLETPPQAESIALPNSGGRFITSYEPSDRSFMFSNVIQFNKAIFSSEEYPYLKEFYNKIIQSEKTEIVFKKK